MGGRVSPRTVAIAVPVIIAWLAGFVFAYGGTDFSLDDAWIHLSYARSLKLGEGLSYNPNDWETGFSSPLWAIAVSILPWFGKPLIAVKTLGVALHGVGAGLAASCAAILAERNPRATPGSRSAAHAALLAGSLVALHPGLLQASVSGMEVTLTTAALLALVWSFLRQDERTKSVVRTGLVAAACVLARPEALYFAGVLGLTVAAQRKSVRALSPVVGGLLGMSVWVLYCLAVSGYPLPNSHYVKSAIAGLPSLQYLGVDVLLSEPWVLSIVGLLLMVEALRQDRDVDERPSTTLLFAWLVALLATAASRHVSTGVLFFHWRYFAIFTAVPIVVLATSIGVAPTRWRYAGALLVVVVTVAGLPSRHALVRAQEHGIRALHTEPALAAARTLPEDAVVLVEGAGASRFFTPRTMWVVDAMGLNDGRIAHGSDSYARICRIYALHPTHLLLPDEFMGGLAPAFSYEVLQKFHDPAFAQTRVAPPRNVWLCDVLANRPDIERQCP